MNKIILVLKREFLSRVQKKTFLLVTIGLPILICGIYAAIIYFSINNTSQTKILVEDNANIFKDSLPSNGDISFYFSKDEQVNTLKEKAQKKSLDGYIYIPVGASLADSIQIVTGKKIGLITRQKIQDEINERIKELKLASLPINQDSLKQAQKASNITFENINDKNDSDIKAGISYGVGFGSGFLIYLILLLYGTAVMRGVMEEKTNRIAEIIVSSVKPFQLMMGKILGIGAVGLLQFIIWIVLGIGLRLILIPLLFPGAGHSISSQVGAGGSTAQVQQIMHAISGINFTMIISMFVVYFIGGYLVYASLFAAIGCTVSDGQQDAQGLQLPITLPIIFGFVIMMQAINNPTSGLSVFGSLFPLTSPVVMMARVAQGVPDAVSYWQLGLSILILFATFLLTTWFAGKIYRTGILMYGKKPTWKELIKWGFRKN